VQPVEQLLCTACCVLLSSAVQLQLNTVDACKRCPHRHQCKLCPHIETPQTHFAVCQKQGLLLHMMAAPPMRKMALATCMQWGNMCHCENSVPGVHVYNNWQPCDLPAVQLEAQQH
jgi:hypothetical protein